MIDIMHYPGKLHALELQLDNLKTEKNFLEAKVEKLKADITFEVDKTAYKNAAIRENNVNFSLYNSAEYVIIQEKLSKCLENLRNVQTEHALLRRQYRLLENEYNTSGIRTFEQVLERLRKD